MPHPIGPGANRPAARRAQTAGHATEANKASAANAPVVPRTQVSDAGVSTFEPAGGSSGRTPVELPAASTSAPGAVSMFDLQLARAGKTPAYDGPPVDRAQALADVLAEAAALGVEIRSGQEADDYLDFAAKMTGMPPEAMQAATLGDDLIFVRDSVMDDPRVLREELIHTRQQAAGISVDLSSTANAEVEARELMMANQARWGITDAEVAEMKHDIALIEQRGRY